MDMSFEIVMYYIFETNKARSVISQKTETAETYEILFSCRGE